MEKVTVTIANGGATEIKVTGHAGPGCKQVSEAIEKAIGSVTSDTKTPEFCQVAKQGQQAKVGL